MKLRSLVAAIVLLLAGQPTFDPLRGSLPRAEPQPIYAPDPRDAWNQLFFLLFTRTVSSQVMADGAPAFASGDERLKLTGRRVTRIESGDRAIDPLYPSWLWLGSSAADFEPGRAWRVLQEPRYSEFVKALDAVLQSAPSRPAIARALMQADLWSAYDMLHSISRPRPGAQSRDKAEREQRAQALLPRVAAAMRALALPGEEIGRLPDTYSAAAMTLKLPALLGQRTDWMEIRWFPQRLHEGAAEHRRAARVFIRPAVRPKDEAAFLNGFRTSHGGGGEALDSVALLIQLLLVSSDGTVVPSPITYEVQFRGTASRVGGAGIPQYELSRQRLLSSPSTGGLVGFDANAPAYLPMAGNDLAFATPPRLDGEPVVAPLGARCVLCHGPGPGVGRIVTFSMSSASDRPVERLANAGNVHAGDVTTRKMEREEYKSLRRHWQ